MKASLRSSSRFIIGLVVLLAATTRSFGSGGSECDDMDCSSFFAPEIIQDPNETPFFLSGHTFYSQPFYPARSGNSNAQDPQEDMDTVNLQEWSIYYRGAIPKTELSFLIYKMEPQYIVELVGSLRGKEVVLSSEAKSLKADFAKYGKTGRVIQSLEYLLLAKRVEPFAMRRANDDGWQVHRTSVPVEPADVQELIDAARQSIREADKFIAERYRLQVMRLLFYSSQYNEAEKYFEQYSGSFTEENSPKYRFMNVAAGAYYKHKQYAKANYLFSLVFDRFRPLKRSAYFSFHPMEDPDWKESLALAKNAHEREVLWQLLGIYADGMAGIDQIYAMNPKSKLLPLLLVREVNKAEHAWTSNHDRFLNGIGQANGPRPDAQVVGAKRLARIKAIADAGNTYKPYLWQLSAGHLAALAGDSRAAESYIDRAARSMPNVPELQAQARMSRLFARVRSIQSIDHREEAYLAQEYEWLQQYIGPENYRARNLDVWTLKQLSDVYLKGGDRMRSLMLTDSEESSTYRSIPEIDTILAFMRNATNPFDKFLVKNYKYSAAQLYELRAVNFLYSGDFTNALESFKLAGDDVKKDLNADPFTIYIRDCHDCDARAPHATYTKVSFTERMLSLSQAAQGQGESAAAAGFELANGFYNMSFYGNSRDIYDTAHRNLRTRRTDNRDSELALNMDLAEKYYLQAASLSADKEFKARALFMAAKAEQNRYFNTRKFATDPQPQKHFAMLKASYSDTRYYQEIIRECGIFRSYLGQ